MREKNRRRSPLGHGPESSFSALFRFFIVHVKLFSSWLCKARRFRVAELFRVVVFDARIIYGLWWTVVAAAAVVEALRNSTCWERCTDIVRNFNDAITARLQLTASSDHRRGVPFRRASQKWTLRAQHKGNTNFREVNDRVNWVRMWNCSIGKVVSTIRGCLLLEFL